MLAYPSPPISNVVDDFFGTPVPDPYRDLEDLDAPSTREWLAAQRRLTGEVLGALPMRAPIADRMRAIVDYERIGLPLRAGPTTIVFKNSGLQNQPVVYVGDANGADRVLLDPNAESADGTLAVVAASLSRDGTLLAYGTSNAGSDWTTFRVRDVATGIDLPDVVRRAKFTGAAWSASGDGFYYSGYPDAPETESVDIVADFHSIFFHRLGTSQADDVTAYERPDRPKMYHSATVSEDGRYLIVADSEGAVDTGIVVVDLSQPERPPVRLFEEGVARNTFVDSVGDRFYVATTEDAPQGRLVCVELERPQRRTTIVAEREQTLADVSSAGMRLFVRYLRDARSAVEAFEYDGRALGEIELPGLGSVSGFDGLQTDRDTFYSFSTFTAPTRIYRYVLEERRSETYALPRASFDSDAFETTQIFATSEDGTKVPVFVVRAKTAPRDGSSPTILYGYGGFSISLTPEFSPAIATWLDLGGTYALATLRGGGEYGRAWHEAGCRERKQNVFDDFAAAARELVARGITSHRKLALSGGSNGGLLTAATLTQRPELAAAVHCDVAVTDMLRYPQFTVGAGWITEYGDAARSAQEFAVLYRYSPLANVTPRAYPATLVTTGDHDDRVFPAHSFKFVAALQAAQTGAAPILLDVDVDAGHGAGKPLGKQIEAAARRYAFFAWALDARFEPGAH